jgi:hypothetical protein
MKQPKENQMDRYQGEPGQVVNYGGHDGETHTLKADATGVISAKTAEDAQMLEHLGLTKTADKKPASPAKEA